VADRMTTIAARVLVWAARISVAAVFVWAAIPKLYDLPTFVEDLRNYQTFPDPTVHLVAGIVPALELVGAAALVSGVKRNAGAIVLGLLTIGFIVLLSSVLVRGIDLQCGCFGRDVEAAAVGWPLVARDVGLLALVGLAAAAPSGLAAAFDRVRGRRPPIVS
jgi:putative oxidoreductase